VFAFFLLWAIIKVVEFFVNQQVRNEEGDIAMKMLMRNKFFDVAEDILTAARAESCSENKELLFITRYDFVEGLVLDKIEAVTGQDNRKNLQKLKEESGNYLARVLRACFGYNLMRSLIKEFDLEDNPVTAKKAADIIEQGAIRYVEAFVEGSLAHQDVMAALKRVQIERKALPNLMGHFKKAVREKFMGGKILAWNELRDIIEDFVFEEVLKLSGGDKKQAMQRFWDSKLAMLENRYKRLEAPLKDGSVNKRVSYRDFEAALTLYIQGREQYVELLSGKKAEAFRKQTRMLKVQLEGFVQLVNDFDDATLSEEGLVEVDERLAEKYPHISKRNIFDFLERCFLVEAYKKKFHIDQFNTIYDKSVSRVLKSAVMQQEEKDRVYARTHPWLASISNL